MKDRALTGWCILKLKLHLTRLLLTLVPNIVANGCLSNADAGREKSSSLDLTAIPLQLHYYVLEFLLDLFTCHTFEHLHLLEGRIF